ncbi:hypothetical protein Patl1_14294 [Pistacia atlantica]|uniref:Uncharacterized protein n=1 Tax=Pistacia atlantica TaxID=434234 RepID=A0ACC1AWP9_9ROSI|nr:hypothetical protein Patl1_14294 [Pistacia atlantica]
MENMVKKWDSKVNSASDISVTARGTLSMLMQHLNEEDKRPVIKLSQGDPAAFPCFRTSHAAEEAVINALRSAKYNCYAPFVGIPPARRAVAEYLSRDLPYKLSPDDVYITSGSAQAMEIILSVLAGPGANILLPRPGFANYEARCAFSNLEVRHYDLLPEKGWEVDLDGVKSLGDENTIAIVIINPGNPCGNVFSYEHLKKIAETAIELGLLVVADEVYGHLTFGCTPFVPMAVFGSSIPIITLGSISKRWSVTGWRLGWLVTCDPTGTLQKSRIVECINSSLKIISNPVTFIQGALPQILDLEKTNSDYFSISTSLLKEATEILCDKIKEIPGITCPTKPEGSVFAMVKLDFSQLEDIDDDMDFCVKLAKEESVIVLPGVIVGLKNWLRISFATDPKYLENGLERVKSFCKKHFKKHFY